MGKKTTNTKLFKDFVSLLKQIYKPDSVDKNLSGDYPSMPYIAGWLLRSTRKLGETSRFASVHPM